MLKPALLALFALFPLQLHLAPKMVAASNIETVAAPEIHQFFITKSEAPDAATAAAKVMKRHPGYTLVGVEDKGRQWLVKLKK